MQCIVTVQGYTIPIADCYMSIHSAIFCYNAQCTVLYSVIMLTVRYR